MSSRSGRKDIWKTNEVGGWRAERNGGADRFRKSKKDGRDESQRGKKLGERFRIEKTHAAILLFSSIATLISSKMDLSNR